MREQSEAFVEGDVVKLKGGFPPILVEIIGPFRNSGYPVRTLEAGGVHEKGDEFLVHPSCMERDYPEKGEVGYVGDPGVPGEAPEVAPDGWQGTLPAEGTRRKLILDTLLKTGLSVEPKHSTVLRFADAVEEALIEVIDKGTTPESGSPASVAMDTLDGLDIPRTRDGAILTISDRVAVAADELDEARRQITSGAMARRTIHALLDDAGIRRIEGELDARTHARTLTLQERIEVLLRSYEARQATIDGLAATVSARADRLEKRIADLARRSTRDDEWVQALVMEAITRAQECDVPFPADVLDELLREHGVRRSLPRHWPHRGEAAISKHDGAEMADDSPGGDDPAATIKFLEGEVERLLGGREEARTGDGRFAEERDCAFALLRWLLPVTVAKRVD